MDILKRRSMKRSHRFFYYLDNKLTISFVMITLVSSMICASFAYIGYQNILNKKISDITETMLNSLNWNLDLLFFNTSEISDIIRNSQDVQKSLSEPPSSVTDYFEQRRIIRNLVTNITSSTSFIKMVYIGNSNYEFYQQSSQWTFTMNQKYLLDNHIISALEKSDNSGMWILGSELGIPNFPKENCLFFIRKIKELNSLNNIGYLVIGVDMSVFNAMINKKQSGDSIISVISDDELLYISDKSINQKELLTDLKQNRKNINNFIQVINDERYLVNYISNNTTTWKIISMTPYKSVMQDIVVLRNLTFLVIAISFFVTLFMSRIMAKRIITPFKMINRVFKSINDWNQIPTISFRQNDEIGQIGIEFINLFRKNQELNKKLYESVIKEKEAELMMLQSQINPHFLYNTLDSIYWMAERLKASGISSMVLNLSKMFRLSLNKGDKQTTVEHEIEHVKCYLEIQNIRYRNKFKTVFDIDPETYKLKMIRMIIQPIVENAIYHGLELKSEEGVIFIKIYRQEEFLFIAVSDNGVGFDPDEVTDKGYALKNIEERIKLFYGSAFGITIESRKMEGTKIMIKLAVI